MLTSPITPHSSFFASHLNIIKNDFLLNDDSGNGTRQENPCITISQSGNAIITWTDFRDGNADIYCQRFDNSGNALDLNFRINTDNGMMWQGEPSISSDIQGNFVVSWEDRRNYNSDVYVQRLNNQGSPINNNFRANDNTGTSDQRNTSTVILPNKTFIITWDDWRNDWGDIFGQRFDSIGYPIGNNFRINDDAAGSNQYNPSIACDSIGNFIAVWMDGRQGNWDIYAQRFTYQGMNLGANFRVNDDAGSYYQADPNISCTQNGQFIVVWEDQRQGNSDIYCQRFDINGNRLGANFKINNDNGTSTQVLPDIAFDNANNFVVTWTDNRDGNYDIFAQIFNNNATPYGQNFKVNNDLSSQDQSESNIAMNSLDEFWIVWKDHRSINSDIFLQRYSSNGTAIGDNLKINDDNASSHQRCSWITQDGLGNYIITWEDERNNDCDIYGIRFDSLGNIIGNNFRVNDDVTPADQYYSSVSSNYNGNFIATWTDGRNNDFDIYAQRFSNSGLPLGNNFRVNNDTTQMAQWYPVASCDSIGNTVIVWMDYRNGNYDIFGQLYDYQSNPIGTNFMVNSILSSTQLYSFVDRNKNGNFVVVWMDDRNGNYDIYAQRYDSIGNSIGSNFKVNDDTGSNHQGYPAVTVGYSGNFYIVWEDDRNENTDIYLQRYNNNGNAIGSNQQVDDDNSDYSQYSPTIGCDETGRYVITWCDFRNNDDDPEIYAQAYNINGTPIGNNQLINQPDIFPANNQWLIGQGVTANSRRMGFAWIDNRRHQGWDIYSKIIDWNYFSGVTEDSDKLSITHPIRIFPNPSTGKILLTKNNQAAGDIQIFNTIGRKVYTIFKKDFINKPELQLDISWLDAGIYFLQYNLSGKPETKKIVITGRKSVEH